MSIISYYQSPLGTMVMVSDGEKLTELDFDGQNFAHTQAEDYREQSLPVFTETCRWLDGYFQGQCPDFTPAIHLTGTPFRQIVWDILLTVPYGQTISYGELAAKAAEKMGRRVMSAQAVGGAVGHNPIALIVPCHRVIGKDGSLTGYASGLWRKEFLLDLEGGHISVGR